MSGTDKITRMLSLYYQLITGKMINKMSFCMDYGITYRSFDRDIEDIRLFLSEEQSYCELKYDRQGKVYYLTNIVGKNIPSEVSFLLVDILFSVKIISKAEMEGILVSLLDATEVYRNKELYDYIVRKLKLKNSWSSVAVLKMHRDLEHAIYEKKLIEINYEIGENNVEMRKVYPVQIRIDNGYVYLIAYIADKDYKNPAFFRLDRIKSFTILTKHFAGEIQEEYIDRTRQIDLHNMMAGDEVEVTVKVCQAMRRIICDVFPSCKFIQQDSNQYYIYKIKTYKQGFLNWILGQEKEVIILEPESLKKELINRLKRSLSRYEGEV